VIACFAGFCLVSMQSPARCAGPTGGQAAPILRLDTHADPYPQSSRSFEHAFFTPLPPDPRSHAATFAGPQDVPPEPVTVPLPPVLLPAAVVLGWVIMRKRRRHP
jgi:hypothetical protein